MVKSVSNILTHWKIDALAKAGIDTRALLEKSGISDYELHKNNGRISDSQHYKLMLLCMNYTSIIRGDARMDKFYALFPELFGLCLNEYSACQAVVSFQNYRFVMGNCDDFIIKKETDRILIEYTNMGPKQLVNSAAIGNFALLCDLIRNYLPSMSVTAGLAGAALASERTVSDLLKAKVNFNQETNYLLISSPALSKRSEFYNERLNQHQKKNLDSMRAVPRPLNSTSQLVADMLEHTMTYGNADGDNTMLDTICSMLKQSRWTLNKNLQSENTSYSEVLKAVRFNKACKLLIESEKSMQEISEITGFSSQAIFSRFFRTQANTSPMQYRKQFKPDRLCG